MLISYSESERGSANSSLWMSLFRGTIDVGTAMKVNDDRWSSDDMVLWLERRQNRDVVE
jgi:hypothetical protein